MLSSKRKRNRQIAELADGPLARYYSAPSTETNDPARPWLEAEYLVLDLETTGLDPDRDHLLSAGWICVSGGAIEASSARHHLVRPPDGHEVGHSATIHHITDSLAASGQPLESVVEALLDDMAGKVLVCHFAQMELGFVGRACRRIWGADLWPPQLIDTMEWHHDREVKLGRPIRPDDLRLYTLLRTYGLPPVRPHHALSDAYGTALLLLAMSSRPDRTLGQLLDRRSWTP